MDEQYLDPGLSVIISSPAGSGKTEKLARRYISLLDAGAKVERILCITFTEKAAAEMKQRILSLLGRERPDMLEMLTDKIPLMRISTIHSFCLNVLKRFSIELGLDPSLSVMDEIEAKDLWSGSVYSSLMDESSEKGLFTEVLRKNGINGWARVRRVLDEMHSRSPLPELLLETRHDSLDDLGEEASVFLVLYSICLEKYGKLKSEHHLIDFNDLELLAYKALSLGPESHNILYSFDEHTDHLLVDEFQDTSTLQWKIIDKLTEEWRSGMGAKRERGDSPSLFLVGDEKQSIYMFRGANAAVFRQAEAKIQEWMGDNCSYVEADENYRSLKAVTDFTNAAFSKIMHAEPAFEWASRYSAFHPKRVGEGHVELLLFEKGENTKDTRTHEAEIIAQRINSLAYNYELIDHDGERRKCRFEDMAVLIRKRTHLSLVESALRRAGIPFVVQKGVGFYEEPEVAVLREMVSYITDPADDYSVFCMLRSPLFELGYPEILGLSRSGGTLIESLGASARERHKRIHDMLLGIAGSRGRISLSMVIERTLEDTNAWRSFSEPQRRANIKKFLNIIDEMESSGLSPVEIRERLIRQRGANQVAKANINAEGMDAVRVMTVHASKGLEFPMVFLPGMDEPLSSSSGPVLFQESGDRIDFWFEDDSGRRNRLEPFRLQKLMADEEQKRLFYVAVTRAMDFLCMIGAEPADKKPSGRLSYLDEAFGIFGREHVSLPFVVLREKDIPAPDIVRGSKMPPPGPPPAEGVFTKPLDYGQELIWDDAASETLETEHGHGRDWTVTGTVMHRIFEELSLGMLKSSDIEKRSAALLRGAIPQGGRTDEIHKRIALAITRLDETGLLKDVILPSGPECYTELPFVMEKGDHVYKGRIDRLIIRDGIVNVYDYKCFPVGRGDEARLAERYEPQIKRYAEAAEKLFPANVKAFLLLACEGRLVEIV